jgi:cell division protein FtsQ
MMPANRRIPSHASIEAPGRVRGSREDAATPRRRLGKILPALRVIAGSALVVALSSGVAWAIHEHVIHSPRFAVTEIRVTGAHQRTVDALLTEAGLSKGANVFSVDLDGARARLLGDPWVSSATLTRRLPGTLLVQVAERELGAVVVLRDTYLASRDGEIFKRFELGDPVDLPVITGLDPDAVADDREGAQATVRRALDLAADYERSPLPQRSLEEIHVTADGGFTLVVGKDALALALGGPPFRHKLEEAARVTAELERRGSHAGAIMLDDDGRPDRVVVRTR